MDAEPKAGTPAGGEAADVDEFTNFKTWYVQDRDHSKDWRQETRQQYDYVAGNQWSSEDAAKLKEELRPVLTFNRIAPVIDSVAGLEVNNRQEVCFFPRHVGDAGVDELLTGAAKWMMGECNAEDEESDSFMDLVICGMGWTETRVEYDEDPDGQLVLMRVDPMEMYWDKASTRKNIKDARRIFRVRDIPLATAEEMFPDEDIEDLHAAWADDTESNAHEPHDAQEAPFYRNDQSGKADRQAKNVRIVECQWWKHDYKMRCIDPITGTPTILSIPDYRKLVERMEMIGLQKPIAVKQRTRVYYKTFIGGKVLETIEGPEKGGFTLKCMTGKRDRNKGYWYGLVRAMLDPQQWANKFLSQTLHIFNSNAKGGVMAEKDAFENPDEAEDSWARPESITYMKKGALSGTNPKVMPKPQPQWPAGLQNLMEFSISSIRDVSGVNLELLGAADREQSGILEHMRKQSAMTVLASLFASLRQYRKEHGVLLLFYITKYLSDGRLVKIGGRESAKYIPLVRRPDTIRYDVIVDDTPTSVNTKESTWAVLQQMLPMLRGMDIPPKVWLSILKYSPLPDSMVAEITTTVEKTPPQPDKDTQRIEAQGKIDTDQMNLDHTNKMQQIQASSEAKIEEIRADFLADEQKRQNTDGMNSTKVQTEQLIAQMKQQFERDLAAVKMQMSRDVKAAEMHHSKELEHAKIQSNERIEKEKASSKTKNDPKTQNDQKTSVALEKLISTLAEASKVKIDMTPIAQAIESIGKAHAEGTKTQKALVDTISGLKESVDTQNKIARAPRKVVRDDKKRVVASVVDEK